MLLSALRVFVFQLRLPIPTRFLNTRHGPYRSFSTMGAIGTQTVDTTDRLAALRKLMAEHNVGAYIVPSEDQRKSLGPSDRRLAQIRILSRLQRVSRRVRLPSGIHFWLQWLCWFVSCSVLVSLLIPILLRHCDRDKGPSISFHGWTLLSSGGETAR
jgi:hypothetical protein